jgi:hypothetical protein
MSPRRAELPLKPSDLTSNDRELLRPSPSPHRRDDAMTCRHCTSTDVEPADTGVVLPVLLEGVHQRDPLITLGPADC